MREIWKPVVGWEGLYSVSNLGRFRRESREREFVVMSAWGTSCVRKLSYKRKVLKVNIDSGGYAQVVLQDASAAPPRRVTAAVHRLVLSAFRRPPGPDDHGMHRNDIRSDNRLANLKWGTKAENARDMAKKGRVRAPAWGRPSALEPWEVAAIQAEPKTKLKDLAARFNISKSNVSKLRAKALNKK